MIKKSALEAVLAKIPELRIAVVGDFFLDKYMVVDPALSELSLETGLEARQVVDIRVSPGAAGTVTNNLAALGVGDIRAIGVIGDDGEGFELERRLAATGVCTRTLWRDPAWFTPTYLKPMRREPGGEAELERLDIKNRRPLASAHEEAIIGALRNALTGGERPAVNAVIVADQVEERNCGVVTDGVRNALRDLAAEFPWVVFLADSRMRIGEYRNVVIKPNVCEAARAAGVEGEPAELGPALARRNGRAVYLTLGAGGMLVCDETGVQHVRGIPVEGPVDIVGAGDSATAGIVCALCAGTDPRTAAAIGNLCASVTIVKLGTTGTASPDELRRAHARAGWGRSAPATSW